MSRPSLKKRMKNILNRLTSIIIFAATSINMIANEGDKSDKDWSKGYLTGSFETSTSLYHKDVKSSATVPDGRFGSNNYLKLDYFNNKISAGIQMEGYIPVLVGYPSTLKGAGLTNYYISWTDDNFSITAGTFYEQFGSGLLFRSWEDRALGLNNAITGARVSWHYEDIISVKVMWGMPKYGMKFSDTQIKGADVSFSLSNLIGWDETYLALEGSVLGRYEELDSKRFSDGVKPNTTGWSARANVESNGFFLKAEYVDGGQKYIYDMNYAGSGNMFIRKRGNAQLIETGYNKRGLGVNLNLRRLEWMESRVLNEGDASINMINYIPALCTQYTYMLTTLNPYNAYTGDTMDFKNSGEMGGQIDVFYNFRRGTALGGKRGMKIHGNFSTFYTVAGDGSFNAGNMLFRDLSIDLEKQWSRKFKTTVLWSMQEYSPSKGKSKTTYLSNIIVADLLYKFTETFSTRMELQYLVTHEDQKDWMAALIEVSFAPHWSISISDMYNHGMTNMHYYNGGFSYVKSRTRIALNYGRYRKGMLCSGGVCKPVPAYTGVNLSFTTSF